MGSCGMIMICDCRTVGGISWMGIVVRVALRELMVLRGIMVCGEIIGAHWRGFGRVG